VRLPTAGRDGAPDLRLKSAVRSQIELEHCILGALFPHGKFFSNFYVDACSGHPKSSNGGLRVQASFVGFSIVVSEWLHRRVAGGVRSVTIIKTNRDSTRKVFRKQPISSSNAGVQGDALVHSLRRALSDLAFFEFPTVLLWPFAPLP
jgi:hypothetical protein